MKIHTLLALAAAGVCTAGMVVFAAPASAAQSELTLNCTGLGMVTVATNNNNSSEHGGWGAAQTVNIPGHGIATSFSGTITDLVTGTSVSFTQVKGNGNANQNTTGQPTMCSQTITGTVVDFTGGFIPPGMSGSDPATFMLTVGVIYKA
jgi:hypothetical protein